MLLATQDSSTQLHWILDNWLSLSTLALIGVLIIYARSWAESAGKQGAAAQLEQQRASLVAVGDEQRALLHRDSTDYAIYAARKHEAIAEFFASAIEARTNIEIINALPSDVESARHAYEILWAQCVIATKTVTTEHSRATLYMSNDIDAAATSVLAGFRGVEKLNSLRMINPNRVDDGKEFAEIHLAIEAFRSVARAELQRAAPK